MDDSFSKTAGGKSLRPVRNRRYSRKSFGIGQRPAKRLFTPEIKRFLKEWLVRRRENPYPNREEKKILAVDTGLTYIQICNWFANWRRKLKNAGNERNRKTWGHLIKTYNNQAQGNVEQFSICSDDSIWGEPEPGAEACGEAGAGDHCYSHGAAKAAGLPDGPCTAQCYHVSSTTEDGKAPAQLLPAPGNKYKSHIMEKYLRGLQSTSETDSEEALSKSDGASSPPMLLTKWLESAAKFQPRQSNYVTWNATVRRDRKQRPARGPEAAGSACPHGREEVEAAVALTRLAGLFRS